MHTYSGAASSGAAALTYLPATRRAASNTLLINGCAGAVHDTLRQRSELLRSTAGLGSRLSISATADGATALATSPESHKIVIGRDAFAGSITTVPILYENRSGLVGVAPAKSAESLAIQHASLAADGSKTAIALIREAGSGELNGRIIGDTRVTWQLSEFAINHLGRVSSLQRGASYAPPIGIDRRRVTSLDYTPDGAAIVATLAGSVYAGKTQSPGNAVYLFQSGGDRDGPLQLVGYQRLVDQPVCSAISQAGQLAVVTRRVINGDSGLRIESRLYILDLPSGEQCNLGGQPRAINEQPLAERLKIIGNGRHGSTPDQQVVERVVFSSPRTVALLDSRNQPIQEFKA